MRNIRQHSFLIFISLLFLAVRIFASDPWTASVITNDTDSYVVTSELSLLSTDFYTGPRSITLPLVYKAFTPPQGFDTSIRSEPSIGKLPGLRDLPGFRNVAFFQSFLSVFSWLILAFALYSKLKNRWLRYVSISYLLLSACLPEIASWDHVMMAESLTYSLFVLLLGLSLFLFDLDLFSGAPVTRNKKIVAGAFLLAMFFWVNARDTNAYFLVIAIFCLFMGVVIPFARRKFHQLPWTAIIIIVICCGILGLQQTTARASKRLINPLINNLTANVFPYKTRVEFLHDKWGMPDSPEIISNKNSANYSEITKNKEFVDWVQQKGLSAYSDFMIHTPLWTGQMLVDSFSEIFGYYKQPYFDPWEMKLPVRINQVTRMINWSSSDLILISFLLILMALGKNLAHPENHLWVIIGMMACLWLGAGVMYSASYLGETWGSASRHIQNVILTYRLLIVVFLPLQFDS